MFKSWEFNFWYVWMFILQNCWIVDIHTYTYFTAVATNFQIILTMLSTFDFWNNLNDKFDLLSPLNIVFSIFSIISYFYGSGCVYAWLILSVRRTRTRSRTRRKKLLGYSSFTFLSHLFCAANALDCWPRTKKFSQT